MTAIPDKFLQESFNDELYLLDALWKKQLSGTAEIVTKYEEALASAFGVSHAVAVSSGSAALHSVLHCIGSGCEVLVPATAPLPSLFPITAIGAEPVPVDIRPDCLDFDPDDLRRKMTEQTRAAMLVPLWGYPIDVSETGAILSEADIPLIEDAAHAHGARIGGRTVGTLGAAGCFSTHDRKLLATGEGGFILTDRADLAEAARAYSRLGNLNGRQSGVNYKLNALAASVGMARLPHLEAQINIRRGNAMALKKRLSDNPHLAELGFPTGSEPNYYNLILMLTDMPSEAACQLLRQINEAGIPIDQIKYGYDVFYRREIYRHVDGLCPNAENFVERVIQLPVHPGIEQDHMDRIVEILKVIEHDS